MQLTSKRLVAAVLIFLLFFGAGVLMVSLLNGDSFESRTLLSKKNSMYRYAELDRLSEDKFLIFNGSQFATIDIASGEFTNRSKVQALPAVNNMAWIDNSRVVFESTSQTNADILYNKARASGVLPTNGQWWVYNIKTDNYKLVFTGDYNESVIDAVPNDGGLLLLTRSSKIYSGGQSSFSYRVHKTDNSINLVDSSQTLEPDEYSLIGEFEDKYLLRKSDTLVSVDIYNGEMVELDNELSPLDSTLVLDKEGVLYYVTIKESNSSDTRYDGPSDSEHSDERIVSLNLTTGEKTVLLDYSGGPFVYDRYSGDVVYVSKLDDNQRNMHILNQATSYSLSDLSIYQPGRVYLVGENTFLIEDVSGQSYVLASDDELKLNKYIKFDVSVSNNSGKIVYDEKYVTTHSSAENSFSTEVILTNDRVSQKKTRLGASVGFIKSKYGIDPIFVDSTVTFRLSLD